MRLVRITLYSRSGCGLCEEAWDVLEAARRELADTLELQVKVVDITTDSALMAQYRYDIPVVAIDDAPAFRHHVAPDRLRRRLLEGVPAPLEERTP